MKSKQRIASRSAQLSLEHLESRILLAPVLPGAPAVLYDGDVLFFVQGEMDPPTDQGGDPTTIVIATFEGAGHVQFYNAMGLPVLNSSSTWCDKIGDIDFIGVDETSNLFIQTGDFTDDWGMGDIETEPLNLIVDLVTDPDTGRYIWWNDVSSPAWMDTYIVDQPAFAPDDSGNAVVTGDIYFDASSTGFGTFALDGALKGSIGMPGGTLGPGETLHEIRVGYIHGPQSDFQGYTVGGTYIDGNIDRLLVQSTVAELDDTNIMGLGDRNGPADIYVGGHLIEFQASSTIRADITVIGNSTTEPYFDFDYRVYNGTADNPGYWWGESYLTGIPAGFSNDTPDRAYVVGSPTGTFTIEGFVEGIGWDKSDNQDWYVFTGGLGETITVDMDYGEGAPTWVFAPSGRLVATVVPDEPVTFVADEGGYYRLMVGSSYDPELNIAYRPQDLFVHYSVTLSGVGPVQLGGIVVGSDIFDVPLTDNTLEFGDDVSDTYVWVGGGAGFIDVRGLGNYADANLDVGGDLGFITTSFATSGDWDYPYFNIGGNFDRLEVRDGDFMFGDGAWPDAIDGYMTIGGNLGEVDVAGTFGQSASFAVASWVYKTPPVTVGGHVGSIVTGGDFFAQLSVYQDGVDLFYVGGDFGAIDAPSSLSTLVGMDVAFAYVEGTIWHEGTTVVSEVQPVLVSGGGEVFVDDGGSTLHLIPVSTTQVATVETATYITKRGTFVSVSLVNSTVPGTLQYRYLPIDRIGGGPIGAAITEISANDAVVIGIESGRADVGYVRLDTDANSSRAYLGVASPDPLAELDIFYVDAGSANVSAIVNYTFQGDIVNVNVGSAGKIIAGGHIGLTERFAPEAGALPNATPAPFVSPPVLYVSQGMVLPNASVGAYGDNRTRYFNGVVASGDVGRIEANGSIGDVYVGGSIGRVIADADGVRNGTAFKFRGMERGPLAWDGLAGVIYAGGDVGLVDPGDGIYGGYGGRPVGGVFIVGELTRFTASDSVIEGPVFATGGIRNFTGYQTLLRVATIGVGADFSDWPIYAPNAARATLPGARLENLRLTGAGSGIDSSMIQVGVLGHLYLGPRTDGWVDSQIWAMGDPVTEEGIGRITILGGGMDGTSPLPYGLWGGGIGTNQNIGNIVVRGPGSDMLNMEIEAFKAIKSVSVQGDIIANEPSSISASMGIKFISANAISGAGDLYIGASELGRLLVRNDVDAYINIEGPVGLVRIGGELLSDFALVGPHGHVDRMIVGRGITGDVSAYSYIGSIDVLSGDLDGSVTAGGSNVKDVAIGRITVRRGDLAGDVSTTVEPVALRPGGGIGAIYVNNGDILGDITATGYYDPIRGNRISADIGIIRVNGTLDGDVTIEKYDVSSPGGDLGKLLILGGDLDGDVEVDGDIGRVLVKNGTMGGTITTHGSDVGSIIIIADGSPAIADGPAAFEIDIEGDLGLLKVMHGSMEGSVQVGGTLGTARFARDVAVMPGVTISVGSINKAYFDSTTSALGGSLIATGHIGHVRLRGGLAATGSITAGAGLDRLQSWQTVNGPITVTGGDVGIIDLMAGADLNGDLTVSTGDVGTLRIRGGQLAVGIAVEVTDGNVGMLKIKDPGETAMAAGSSVLIGGNTGKVLLTGDVEGDIQLGDGGLGDGVGVFVLRGDLQADLAVQGDVGQISIIGGQVTNNSSLVPRIEVTGDVGKLQVYGYTGGGAVIDDDIYVGDELGYFRVRNGNFDGTLEAGSMQRVYYDTPNGIIGDLTSHGDLDLLIVRYGPISASVQVDIDAGRIVARRGMTNGSINVSGSLSELSVGRDVLDSDITVAGTLSQVFIAGTYTDSNIEANMLSRVTVRGQVSSVGLPHDEEIRAHVGSFDLFADGVYYDIHDFAGEMINGVHAYVG